MYFMSLQGIIYVLEENKQIHQTHLCSTFPRNPQGYNGAQCGLTAQHNTTESADEGHTDPVRSDPCVS